MAKILMELHTGSLLDLFGKQYIMSGKPAVAENTSLVNSTISAGKAKLIAQLKDDATQDLLDKYLADNKLKEFIAKYDANAKEDSIRQVSNSEEKTAIQDKQSDLKNHKIKR